MRFLLYFILGITLLSCGVSKKAVLNSGEFNNLELASLTPDSVFVLHLEKQQLSIIPSQIFMFKNLKELYLNKNKLDSIPDEILRFDSLEVMDISNNKFLFLNPKVFLLPNLKKLSAYNNELYLLPNSFQSNSKIEYLNFGSNSIGSLPSSITKLQKIEVLDLKGIQLSKNEVQEMKKLLKSSTQLNISNQCGCLD